MRIRVPCYRATHDGPPMKSRVRFSGMLRDMIAAPYTDGEQYGCGSRLLRDGC